MKKNNNYFWAKRAEEAMEADFNDYIDLFEEGYDDKEISAALGVDEKYIQSLRMEYQRDY